MLDVIEALVEVSESMNKDDVKWAGQLLEMWAGDAGYNRIVGAAVVGGCMVNGTAMIRKTEKAADDAALTASIVAKHLEEQRILFKEGAIFLESAKGTLTHTVLTEMQGRVVHYSSMSKKKAVSIAWPSPGSMALEEPIRRASAFFDLYEAYFNANFPGFADINLLAFFPE